MKKCFLLFCFTILAFTLSAQTKIPAKDASNYVGKTVTICDKVFSTKLIAGSNMTLLNLGGSYPNQLLTVMIKGTDRSKFKGQPEVDFKGKDVCVTGVVVLYKDKPEIVVSNPEQIK